MRLKGKAIVVIGGTTGLGLAGARAFIREGASVVVVGRKAEDVRAAELALGNRSRALDGDACDPSVAPKAIAAALHEFGRFDGLYHVAGGSGRKQGDGPLHAVSDEGWNYTVNENLTSLFYSNRAAARQFLEQGGGAVLNMSSVLAFSPSPKFFATHAYAAAKAAVIGLTKSAAAQYAPQNIRFNVIAPALVATPMSHRAQADDAILAFARGKQPLAGGGMRQPEDLDAAVTFLLSDESKCVTGQVLVVDGGWCVSEGQAP